MSYDYDDDADDGTRVLWGRVAFAVAAALLFFLIGRVTAGDGPEVTRLRAQVQEVASENSQLQESLAAAEARNGGPSGDPGDASEGDAPGSVSTEGAETYVVESGDTLRVIAEEFYGDGAKFTLIVDANDLSDDNTLQIGQELVIPPDPDGSGPSTDDDDAGDGDEPDDESS